MMTKRKIAVKNTTDKKEGSLKKGKVTAASDSVLPKDVVKKTAAKKTTKRVEASSVSKKEKKPREKEVATEFAAEKATAPEKYFEAVGRRKTAVARVRLFTRGSGFMVNDKPHQEYFPTAELQKMTEEALRKMKSLERFRVSVRVRGGGINAQAEAVRHGTARALVKFNSDFRKRLKRAGFLRRDPRAKERKKFGLKKARRAPQWQKR